MDNKIIELLEASINKRQPLLQYTNALRLVNGIGDGLRGLVLEQYNCHFVIQIFDKRWLKEKQALVDFIKQRFNCQYLIIKDRSVSVSAVADAFKASVCIEQAGSETIVQENNLKFTVDLNDTFNSGLFLDMRRNRKAVAEVSKGKKALNCFAYTCSFGVYCQAAGAQSVVNVDISQKGLSRGERNYELNQLAFSKNEFMRADASRYLKRACVKDNRFDLIILDPPSFARYEGKTFSIKKDFPQLISSAIKALNPQGFLFVSTNFSKVSFDNLEGMVSSAAGERQIKNILRLGQDEDFPGSCLMPESYLAALLVEF